MKISVPLKISLVFALSLAAATLGWLNLVDRTRFEEPTDGIQWVQTPDGLVAEEAATSTGLQPGDRLQSINEISVRTLDDYTEVLEVLTQALPSGTEVPYRIDRAEVGVVSLDIPVTLRAQFGQTDFLLTLVALIYLVTGLFILLRNRRAAGALHFYFICLTAFILLLYRHSGRADLFDLAIYWCSATAFLLLPSLFLHFCCYFPEPVSFFKRSPRSKVLFYLPFFFLWFVHAAWFSGRLEGMGLPRNVFIAHFFDSVHMVFLVSFILLGALILATTRREMRSAEQSQQMTWLTRGTLSAILPFALLYAIPFLLEWPVSVWMEASILSLAVLPLSFAYAITKYRLMDVDVIYKKGVAYVLSSSALLALYVGIVLAAGRLTQQFSPESSFLLFGATALLVAFLFAPLKDLVQNQIDRYFYREQFDYRRSFADFGRTLGSEVSLSSLGEKVIDRLTKTLQLEAAGIFLRLDGHQQRHRLIRGFGRPAQTETTEIQVPECVFSDYDRQLKPIFHLPPDQAVYRFREELGELGLDYLQPLRVHGRVTGFLGLSTRRNGKPLSNEDLDLVSTFADYAAIAFENAVLYESLASRANELVRLKAYSDNVIASITLGVAVINPDGRITVWNDGMASILETPPQSAVGGNARQLLPAELTHALRKSVGGNQWTVTETIRFHKVHFNRSDGQVRLVNVTLSPFILQDDIVTGTLMVVDDVTEKVQLESQLMQAEKLSSIGLFAAGIAHEVNTPLTGISSYTQMLLQQVGPSDPHHEILKKIEKQSFRASDIINNLLNFARFSPSDSQEVNLNSLMLETLSLLEHQLRKGKVEVELDLDPTLPNTVGNGGKLQQVFMNLFLNAKDAMPEGGRLRIKTSQRRSSLIVRIKDTGTGIAKEHLRKIYDPFFTTKEVGKGTGLGLAVSYGIIQEHSGRINVESEPGSGTVFTLHLPIRRVN